MRQKDSHVASTCYVFDDFSGGENYLSPPSLLEDNEVALAMNLEFDRGTGLLQTRPGLRLLSDVPSGPIPYDSFSYVTSSGAELRAYGKKLYIVSRNVGYGILSDLRYVETYVGDLSGWDRPMVCEWGQNPRKVLIASGGVLQSLDPTTRQLTDINISDVQSANGDVVYEKLLHVNIVFTLGGRVVVSQSGDDTLFYSAIGDETTWVYDSNDLSLGQAVDVGYKDGGDIVSVVPMGKDLIVFKTSGIFRVTGVAPDWTVYELSRTYRTANRFSALQLGNDCLFIDPSEGVCRLSSVEAYGDLKVSGYGSKINSGIKGLLTADSYLLHVRKRGQVFVVCPPHETIYALHYGVGDGAWTHYKLNPQSYQYPSPPKLRDVFYDDYTGNVFASFRYRSIPSGPGRGGTYVFRDCIFDTSWAKDIDGDLLTELRIRQFDLEDDSLLKKQELVSIPRSDMFGKVVEIPYGVGRSHIEGGSPFIPEGSVRMELSCEADNNVTLATSTGCYCLDPAVSSEDEVSFVNRNVLRSRAISPILFGQSGRFVVKELRFWISEV